MEGWVMTGQELVLAAADEFGRALRSYESARSATTRIHEELREAEREQDQAMTRLQTAESELRRVAAGKPEMSHA
jgi:hypothetical protein